MSHSPERQAKWVVLGRVGKIHGIQGWLKLNSFTAPPENILNYPRLRAEIGGQWQDLEIDQSRQQPNGLLVHFKGFDDPESARRLTGLELAVDSAQLPPLDEGDYYWHELQGMTVANTKGELFGRVAQLLATGANDVLVVEPNAESIDQRERLIPFLLDSVVVTIDAGSRKIVVDWEADYLE